MVPSTHTVEDTDLEVKSKTQKKFKVVLFNDEEHTYDYVVEMLTKVCELKKEDAFKCAVEVDLSGRTIVYNGSKDACKNKRDQINSYGPDYRMINSLGSMNSEVEVG